MKSEKKGKRGDRGPLLDGCSLIELLGKTRYAARGSVLVDYATGSRLSYRRDGICKDGLRLCGVLNDSSVELLYDGPESSFSGAVSFPALKGLLDPLER